MAGSILRIGEGDLNTWIATLLLSMPVMLVAVGPAFLLHEIGHKIVAKKYGCWAEFRVDPSGLKFGIALVALTGILFMAPGAVMVAGLVTRRQNGHIAIAGPAVNFSLFLIGIPLGGIILGLTGATESAAYIESGAINLKAMIFDTVYLVGICKFGIRILQYDSIWPSRWCEDQGLERTGLVCQLHDLYCTDLHVVDRRFQSNRRCYTSYRRMVLNHSRYALRTGFSSRWKNE